MPDYQTPALKPALSGPTLLPTKMPRDLVATVPASDLRADCDLALHMARPATLPAFGLQVERLAIHSPENRLTMDEQKVLKGDWWRLLGHVPADLMAIGVDRFILSKSRFFPTPGQFLDLIESDLRYRQRLADRASAVLDILNASTATQTQEAA